MTRARDVSRLITTPPSIYATDTETSSAGYLTNSSASSTYQTKALNQFAHRNLVINGAMQVAQRGTSTANISGSINNYYTADRWNTFVADMGTWTQSLENDAPTGSGFCKSLKMLCTTADAAPAASDLLVINHRLEGQNLQSLLKGTSSAQQLSLSFWVKSNVTGTYITQLNDSDNSNRHVNLAYTVNSSGVWEKKTIVFPADTTGALDNDNAQSLELRFWLGAGSNFTSGTLQTTWGANTAANRAVGQVNLASAISNYWQVTGVQLEVGDTATPFEFKSFDKELEECRRYYENSWYPESTQQNSEMSHVSNTTGYLTIRPKVSKRVVLINSNTSIFNGTTANQVRNMNTNGTVNVTMDGTAINGSSTNIISLYDLSPFGANTAYDFNWIVNAEL
jgi:hypothetical protein